MGAPDDLLTLSEAVGRLRDAQMYTNDRSRRSTLQSLMSNGALTDYLVLGAGRQRASKFDKRISARDVDGLLARRGRAAERPRRQSETRPDGYSAIEELNAQVGVLMQDLQAARLLARDEQLAHENELYQLRRQVLDLEHKVRVDEINTTGFVNQLHDEAQARRTLENIVTQLVGPNDIDELLHRR